ncbi:MULTISPECIES: MMPL family transporter [Streptomyces]|uniref:MMPL family transporter n=1 Tax=Streptomyces mirabilis TaxID=68239 RepID=A0ABU3UEY5_9ACTN|nr:MULTISPECIES: MMPL family transporter [Streptomyces]MCX4613814.1 MMPL family transporter [Streptomyces mirabilis]MCX5353941.1 MMPL family transporter [Streptomyces mirabilis]MDU8992486.1 MMPL family transporter [Streptomyces mirabilis]QDN91858.1 MMPL family transporter [Streptomyces sp. RLB3-6]QDO12682.1 MMPL family transporter [Streptomyces sp. S1D4-23]
MPAFLHRLGRLAFRRRRRMLALWLALVAAAVVCMTAFGGTGKLDNTFSIPGSESQRALDRMKTDFPTFSGTSAQIVFTATDGQKVTDPADSARIRAALGAAASAPQVAKVVSPFDAHTISADGTTAVAQVRYEVPQSALEPNALDELKSAVAGANQQGMRVDVGGSAFGNAPSESHRSDIIGVGVALVILTLTFGSLLTAGIPVVTALFGVATAIFGALSLTGTVSISSTAQSLALMIGLAVGIDYALFIVSRHRFHLAHGMEPEDSAALAVGTAGSAVVFAGLTVVIAMTGLTVVGIPYLTAMGLAAAGAVLIAVLVATTLLPAILGFAGTRLTPGPGSRAMRREQAVGGTGDNVADGTGESVASRTGEIVAGGTGEHVVSRTGEHVAGAGANAAERWFRLVTRRPLLTLVAVVASLGALAWPAHDMRLALPDNGTAPKSSSQRIAFDRVGEKLGPGFNGPLLVLADTSHSSDPTTAAQRVAATIGALPDVATVGKPVANPATHTALIQVIPDSAPSDPATKTLVNSIRDDRAAILRDTGATVQVTGSTAVSVDVATKLNSALIPFAAVVIGLSLLLLLLVFRSLVVPLKAAAGFLLSIAATLGAVVGVFQLGHLGSLIGVDTTGPVSSFLPIILLAVLFGLAMDYEVFLVSRMRESYLRTGNPLGAVHSGARHSGRVVTAAALIMTSVFAAFLTSDSTMLKQIAFALAAGVLLDAFVIRMTFVPAVLALTRHAAWWLPKWLERRLPDLDIEGDRLGPAAAVPESVALTPSTAD